jgi:hypothetical protein
MKRRIGFMKRKRKLLFVVVFVLYTVILAGISFFIGNQSARKQIENLADGGTAETFYAEISDRKNNFLRVTGLEINDINFRGDFVFSIDEETKMTWRYTEISVEDLDIGDTVSITFTGEIQETAPAKITHVTQIQLLEDEK